MHITESITVIILRSRGTIYGWYSVLLPVQVEYSFVLTKYHECCCLFQIQPETDRCKEFQAYSTAWHCVVHTHLSVVSSFHSNFMQTVDLFSKFFLFFPVPCYSATFGKTPYLGNGNLQLKISHSCYADNVPWLELIVCYFTTLLECTGKERRLKWKYLFSSLLCFFLYAFPLSFSSIHLFISFFSSFLSACSHFFYLSSSIAFTFHSLLNAIAS